MYAWTFFCHVQAIIKIEWVNFLILLDKKQIKAKPYLLNEPPQNQTKPTKWHVRPAKNQIILGIRPVWSESSLSAQWVAKDPSFLQADSEDWSDWADAQADLSLRWVHVILLVLSCCGSNVISYLFSIPPAFMPRGI